MSFVDFLNSTKSVITSFITWVTTISDTLLSNYFVICVLGLSLFFSCFYLVNNLIKKVTYNKKFDIDNYLEHKHKRKNSTGKK